MIRRPALLLLAACAGWSALSLLWAQPPSPTPSAQGGGLPAPVVPAVARPGGGEPDTKVVDFTADLMRPVKVADSSALSLVGHVVFHHNGAVITCDSAIRYNDRQMDCYRNVIINQDSVFVYGDRVEYDGNINQATVYAPLIKMVDKDAVFYTYHFTFNTLDNIGHYTGGGTMLQNENRMESQEGFYYSDDRLLVGIHAVEMENPDYRMRSDSVFYNMDTEVATFRTRSYIWNSKDEFLTALRGEYDRKAEKYTFTDHSYVLTGNQEIWADTLIYTQQSGDALLLSNVQVDDREQRAMAFGDFIRYWGQERKAVLTRDPVVASYEEGSKDTLYMRADSMFIYTVNRFDSLATDTLSADTLSENSFPEYGDLPEADHLDSDESAVPTVEEPEAVLPAEEDPLVTQKLEDMDRSLSAKEKKALKRQQKREARDEALRAKLAKRRAALSELQREAALADSLSRADSLAKLDTLPQIEVVDSTLLAAPVDTIDKADSLLRKMFAYRNVRIFRNDFQAVCDSMTGFTLDSTAHMYIHPVMWNEENQIMSTEVDIYTRNQTIDKVVFTGEPIMSSEVDGVRYNQIKGKVMEVYFAEGVIQRTDVVGNGQMNYYMEDKDSLGRYLTGFMTLECADVSFYFEPKLPEEKEPPGRAVSLGPEPETEAETEAEPGQELTRIVPRGNPVYAIYPLDKIPGEVSETLPGFTWEKKRRPQLKDVFTREMRPSEREQYEALEKPRYPITEGINRDRERLLKEGWRDRLDPLSSEAVEFLRTLR